MADLQELLDNIQVGDADVFHNTVNGGKLEGVLGWYTVSTPDEGVVAYFRDPAKAHFFRMSLINATLNNLYANPYCDGPEDCDNEHLPSSTRCAKHPQEKN
jgi:hypothetical protein